MKTSDTRKNMKSLIYIFAGIFLVLIVYLFYAIYTFGDRWFVAPYNPRLNSSRLNVVAGTIYDRQDKKLAYTQSGDRKYLSNSSARKAVAHVVGDTYGLTRGAETFFARALYGFDEGVYNRFEQAMAGKDRRGNDIVLTVDSKLSEYILDKLGARSGAVVVQNYRTGEILALVSTPAFDQLKIKEYTDFSGETELFNRATMGRYPPGSIFKTVVAAAVLENPASSIGKITCEGKVVIDGNEIYCAGKKAHGEVDLKSAFSKSCNVYFALQSIRLGANALQNMSGKFRFNDDFMFGDIILYKSIYKTPADDFDLAQSGFGQYHDLITPLHACMIAGGIANDGNMMTPLLLKSEKDSAGNILYSMKPKSYSAIQNKLYANELKQMMIDAVNTGTGSGAKIKNHVVGGKTGTAQYIKKDNSLGEHAWFIGFVADEDSQHTYSIAVLLEGGGSGGAKAAPLAKSILAYTINKL